MTEEGYPVTPYYQTVIDGFIGNAPCGDSLEYDSGFLLLQSRLQPKMGAEYGDFVESAEPVNWNEIERDCRALLQKSLDVRLFIILIRCRMRQHGISELAAGLNTILFLLAHWPDDLHPQLVDEGDFEPLMRANAFSELDNSEGFLADLRALTLPNRVGLSVSIKDYERACAVPRDDACLSEAAIAALQQEWLEQDYSEIAALSVSWQRVTEIQSQLAATMGDVAPDLSKLMHILTLFKQNVPVVMVQATPVDPERTPVSEIAAPPEHTAQPEPVTAALPPAAVHASRVINSRHAAVAQLCEVRNWFISMEPSSPIIQLLDFAEKMAGKSFAELIRYIPADMISQLGNDKE